MRNIIIGIVLGVLLVFGVLKTGTPLIAQQGRFELHGIFGTENRRIEAMCDTGNGAMIYSYGGGIAVLPNGCNKK